MTTNNDTAALRTALAAAAARRRAELEATTKYTPPTPADRSRNGQRTPRSSPPPRLPLTPDGEGEGIPPAFLLPLPTPQKRGIMSNRALTVTIVAIVAFLTGLFAPWDLLPWNQTSPCDIVEFEDESWGTLDPLACTWEVDTASDH
jgi:hypothetical protein